jgi:eukaryotic-like serine/threonine-protein kinase
MAFDPARAKSLFLAAADLAVPAERAAYLDRACGEEAELRARVEALLRANDASPLSESEPAERTGNYAPDAPVPTTDYPRRDEQAGTVIAGKYTLVERIGEGGMGSVWRARQTESVKRYVAVKLIKAGMDSKQVLARFDAERQALALMDHPNIAKVLDGGLHEYRPFFVMELVKGVPITDFCDARKLTPKERLELFVPVCQAIQHAHQKGIIHRDIKPSNVLIALYDDKAVVKVIDFGVAKATGGTLTEQTIETGFGGVVGTPQYMSPEQATFNNLDIDTRSDVYALGVLLYELLTGSPPFSKKDLEKKGLLEILRVVREEEPPRPSMKLSTDDALPTLSANRGMEPKRLTGLLRSELDWIVMKALEKDRARRYATAIGFAADVLRYLGGEAVQAHPPSTVYRLKKFVKRYKGQVLAVSVVFLALVAGIVGTMLGLLEAKRQEWAALEAKGQAERERDRADGNFRLAKEAVEQNVTRVAENPRLKQGGFHDLRKSLLVSAVPFYEQFVQQVSDDPGLEAERGRAYGRLALVRKEMGELREARADFERALAIFTRLTAENPSARDPRNVLGATYFELGNILREMGDLHGAEAAYRAALKVRQQLTEQDPTVAEFRRFQANVQVNLGIVLLGQGERKAAEREFRAAREEYRRLVEENPNKPDYLNALATSHHNIANLLAGLGKWADAEDEFRAALKRQGELVGRYPAIPEYRHGKANSHHKLGVLLRHIGQWPAADAEFRAALKEQQRLVDGHPAVPDYRDALSKSHTSLGDLLGDRGRPVEAEVELRAAREELQRLTVK